MHLFVITILSLSPLNPSMSRAQEPKAGRDSIVNQPRSFWRQARGTRWSSHQRPMAGRHDSIKGCRTIRSTDCIVSGLALRLSESPSHYLVIGQALVDGAFTYVQTCFADSLPRTQLLCPPFISPSEFRRLPVTNAPSSSHHPIQQ